MAVINDVTLCEWHNTEISFVASIPFPLIRQAVRNGMEAAGFLNHLFRAYDQDRFWSHIRHPENLSHLQAMVSLLDERMKKARACYGFKKLLALAVYPETRQRDPHLEDCHPCRSEVGWIASNLPSYGEFKFPYPKR